MFLHRFYSGCRAQIKNAPHQETHPVKAISRESLNKIEGKIRAIIALKIIQYEGV